MFKVKNANVQNDFTVSNGYRKLVNKLLTGAGLLLLTFVFGASSDAFGQTSDPQEPAPVEAPPAPEPLPDIDFDPPAPQEPTVIEIEPRLVIDDTNEVKGIVFEGKVPFELF